MGEGGLGGKRFLWRKIWSLQTSVGGVAIMLKQIKREHVLSEGTPWNKGNLGKTSRVGKPDGRDGQQGTEAFLKEP